ncbi:MAG TPA: glucose-6-phosphate isomerase, partial [Firmicutes bacterium]|nr:glucose-6-phosphate isomerase [Bacillota bacterium]
MIKIHFQNLMSETIGKAHGISTDDLRKTNELKQNVMQSFNDKKQMGRFPFMDLPFKGGSLPELQKYAAQHRQKFRNLVIIGIGGSALGNICLLEALKHTHYNLLPDNERSGPRIFIPDNVDPDLINDLFDIIDPKETLFNIITKSGSTAESMANFIIVRRRLRETVGEKFAEHLVFTTDPEKGDLRAIAKKENIASFPIPPDIGGRFSVLTPVGLFMSEFIGIKSKAILDGAKEMINRISGEEEDIA